MWIAGLPCTGKTFVGDYLAMHGYTHVDGDAGNQFSDGPVKDAWEKLATALHLVSEQEEVSGELWMPYYEYLVKQVKQA